MNSKKKIREFVLLEKSTPRKITGKFFQNHGFTWFPRIKTKTHLRRPFCEIKWLILILEQVHLHC